MQHTLVPIHERKLIRKEYHIRVWIVALFAVSVAGVIGVAALFPGFMKASLEERTQLDAIASLEKNKSANGITAIEQELATDKILLAALGEGTDRRLTSAEIEAVITVKGTVKLTGITVSRASDGVVSIVVQGTAPTRESLLSFKTRVEAQIPGTAATLPISQLAKSSNIQFSMQIVRPKP
ncbi:MAG: hypothetical protein V4481_05380 [Patescibacteria group bacterium]